MMLGPGEWLLTVPMAGIYRPPHQVSAHDLPRYLRELAGGAPGPGVRPVPVPQCFGPAVLHFSGVGGSVIYCAEDEISEHCARALTVVLNRAGMLSPFSGAAYNSVTFSRISHHEMPEPLRPAAAAAAFADPARLVIFACDDLLGPCLADALERLCTTQARYLPSVSSLAPPRVLQPCPAHRNPPDDVLEEGQASG